ncbi:MAG: aminomethyl-transferring glycine dehydrogenase subunit GcvPB [Anaerolineae bacterium]|nr:aminomethyl-transferring glycine dehydrogenase subunit GcvPB [Anaerolineae bacterium]
MNDPEPLIFELSSPGQQGCMLPNLDVPPAELPVEMLRDDLVLPEVAEVDVVRHFVRLSQLNFAIDKGFYPLGSCTMKYNPKINEDTARLPGFAQTHPYQPQETVQGSLELLYKLQEALKALSGFAAITLQPAAGAHGEFAGVLAMRACHLANGDACRDIILIPDSAHGTNPASTAMCGYRVQEIKSDARGNVDLQDLQTHCNDRIAGMMLTNPNTLGLFDEHVLEVCDLIHDCGGLMYGDGANFNALLGIAQPATLGFDVMHFNLHKTFSTPHGGGGPGAGPVGVSRQLADFLPGPIVEKEGDTFKWSDPPRSVGRMRAFYGNFGVLVRAYTYITSLGAAGLREVSEMAVLNANYLRVKLQEVWPLAIDRICMHEFVLQGPHGAVHTIDIAKRLMDYGHAHPPTIYFPLIVPEAMMIEPTETESKRTLDQFVEDMKRIAEEAQTNPDLLHKAPHGTPVRRLDEVQAARKPVLCYKQ